MIEPVSAATQAPALRYLARSPYLNVFLTHLLLHDPAPPARKNVVVATNGETVNGVAYYGRQSAIAAEPSTIEAFARYAHGRRGERMIVGDRDTVRAYWQAVQEWHAAPRLVRDRQYVMVLDRAHLRRHDVGVTVRHALLGEWRDVADGSAEMVRQELAYDPGRDSPEFVRGIRAMIERKLWWVGLSGDRLCFFCNVGPWCDRTVQLQGIWTPPALRGRGLATAALSAVCQRLLETSPTVSLYVNDFNEAAVALYARAGFRRVGDFQTLLF